MTTHRNIPIPKQIYPKIESKRHFVAPLPEENQADSDGEFESQSRPEEESSQYHQGKWGPEIKFDPEPERERDGFGGGNMDYNTPLASQDCGVNRIGDADGPNNADTFYDVDDAYRRRVAIFENGPHNRNTKLPWLPQVGELGYAPQESFMWVTHGSTLQSDDPCPKIPPIVLLWITFPVDNDKTSPWKGLSISTDAGVLRYGDITGPDFTCWIRDFQDPNIGLFLPRCQVSESYLLDAMAEKNFYHWHLSVNYIACSWSLRSINNRRAQQRRRERERMGQLEKELRELHREVSGLSLLVSSLWNRLTMAMEWVHTTLWGIDRGWQPMEEQGEEHLARQDVVVAANRGPTPSNAATLLELEYGLLAIDQRHYKDMFLRSRDKLALLILYSSGAKIGSLLHCTVASLGPLFHGGVFSLPGVELTVTEEIIKVSSGLTDCLTVVQACKSGGDLLFAGKDPQKPLHRQNLVARINQLLEPVEAISKKKISSHSFKRGHMESLVDVAGIRKAQEISGHADSRTILSYCKVGEDGRDKHALADQVERRKQGGDLKEQPSGEEGAEHLTPEPIYSTG